MVWTLFAVSAVGAFLMIAAYWLDVQDRHDFSFRQRVGWSFGTFLFPVSIPAYAFLGNAGWPPFLRAASLLPPIAVALFFGFLFGIFS